MRVGTVSGVGHDNASWPNLPNAALFAYSPVEGIRQTCASQLCDFNLSRSTEKLISGFALLVRSLVGPGFVLLGHSDVRITMSNGQGEFR